MHNPITYLISWHRQRQERIRMYRELNECLSQVARAMDDFGDVLIDESRTRRYAPVSIIKPILEDGKEDDTKMENVND